MVKILNETERGNLLRVLRQAQTRAKEALAGVKPGNERAARQDELEEIRQAIEMMESNAKPQR